MKRNTLRFSILVGVVLLLALALMSGCTRSKSSSPPTATKDETGSQSATAPPPSDATPVPGEDPISVTTTAWANETATAEAQAQQPTKAPATTVPEPTKSVEPTSPPETKAPEPTKEPEPTESAEVTQPTEGGVHVVQSGENLFRIALDYGLSYEALATHNGIVNPNLIYVGQELKIPSTGAPVTPPSQGTGASYHIVQPDENLFRVALEYNMLFTELAAANGLSYPYAIYVGQKLIIP